jgi:hypothetical protein
MLTVVYLIAERYILMLQVTSARLPPQNYNEQEERCKGFDSKLPIGQVVLAVQNRHVHDRF